MDGMASAGEYKYKYIAKAVGTLTAVCSGRWMWAFAASGPRCRGQCELCGCTASIAVPLDGWMDDCSPVVVSRNSFCLAQIMNQAGCREHERSASG